MNKNDILKGLQEIIPNDIIEVDEPLKNTLTLKLAVKLIFIFHLLKMRKYKRLLNMQTKIIFQSLI